MIAFPIAHVRLSQGRIALVLDAPRCLLVKKAGSIPDMLLSASSGLLPERASELRPGLVRVEIRNAKDEPWEELGQAILHNAPSGRRTGRAGPLALDFNAAAADPTPPGEATIPSADPG
ncbi:hypothetical protein [Geminicoccus roseus]|uniref:hypothetical protein n=1 Tax=Geminicoccus roseus TaxID=404900 RepID=UPI00048920C7|nr:hypothetical protein [Geminicoccus roseus]